MTRSPKNFEDLQSYMRNLKVMENAIRDVMQAAEFGPMWLDVLAHEQDRCETIRAYKFPKRMFKYRRALVEHQKIMEALTRQDPPEKYPGFKEDDIPF